MNILIHSVQLPHIISNLSLWKFMKDKGHKLLFVIYQRDLEINNNLTKQIRNLGFNVFDGKKTTSKDILSEFVPDVFFPIKRETRAWKRFRNDINIQIPTFTIQTSFSTMKGKTSVTKKVEESNISYPWHFVWGEQNKQRLFRGGIPSSRIIISGNPAWDYCYSPNNLSKKFILFIGGTKFNYIADLFMVTIYNEFKYKFVFKDHPVHFGWFKTVAGWLMDLPRARNAYEENVSDLIKEASVVISTTSTCAIESMMLGKPTIIIDIGKDTDKFKDSGRLIPRSHYVFKEELNKCLKEKEDRSKIPYFLEKVSYKNDGKASERITNMMEKIQQRRQ